MGKKIALATLTTLLLLGNLLAGCSAAVESLPVSTISPSTEQEPSATPTPTLEAERGTRENPLAIGESRKISELSMWTVGATAATEVHDGYVILPLFIGIDWEASRAQAEAQGEPWTADQEGIDPSGSLSIEYVTADGRSFKMMDHLEAEIPNELWRVGTVYPPVESLTVNYAVSVPTDQVPGGAWVVRNFSNETIFIAAQ